MDVDNLYDDNDEVNEPITYPTYDPAVCDVFSFPIYRAATVFTKSPAASIVYGCLLFLVERTDVIETDNALFIAFSVKEISRATGLAYAQTRKAIEKLRKKNIIETKVKRHKGIPMLHFKLAKGVDEMYAYVKRDDNMKYNILPMEKYRNKPMRTSDKSLRNDKILKKI